MRHKHLKTDVKKQQPTCYFETGNGYSEELKNELSKKSKRSNDDKCGNRACFRYRFFSSSVNPSTRDRNIGIFVIGFMIARNPIKTDTEN
jgi:hypothetical protein